MDTKWPSHQKPRRSPMIGGLAARPSGGTSKKISDSFGRKPNVLGATADLYGFRGPPSLAKNLQYHHQHRQGVCSFNCPLCPMCPPRCARNAPPPLCRLCRPSVPAVPPAVPTVPPAVPSVPPVVPAVPPAVPAVPPRCAGCTAFPRQLCPPPT